MNKQDRVIKNIKAQKDLNKYIENREYYSHEQFYNDCQRYVKAIKEGRVICSIGSVSASGMSRTIKFLECTAKKSKYSGQHSYLNFFVFMEAQGYKSGERYRDYFRIHGCGMDMIFHTNYSIMHSMRALGVISKAQCSHLAQKTPSVV